MTVIGMLLTGSYTVERAGAGTYRFGEYVPGPVEEFSVQGSMQPLSARELKFASEGMRLKQLYKFYSDKALLTINTKQLAGADVVKINGDTFKVISEERWDGTMMPYFKSVLAREPEQ